MLSSMGVRVKQKTSECMRSTRETEDRRDFKEKKLRLASIG